MASGIYAIAHIGNLRLYVCDASKIKQKWPQLLTQFNSGNYPHALLQQAWNDQGGKRRFSFHTYKDIADDTEIINIEQLAQDRRQAQDG
ncbi:MAG: hypothetical protein F6K58_11760 [Symploca sp. SIO2E9]|nr:hypothetical protein [Symploca sp. SIO2E9]